MTIDEAIKFCDKIIRNAILEYADTLSLDDWIPVSERLPEEGQYVLVTFCGKIVGCLAHDNNGTLQEITSFVFFKKMQPKSLVISRR